MTDIQHEALGARKDVMTTNEHGSIAPVVTPEIEAVVTRCSVGGQTMAQVMRDLTRSTLRRLVFETRRLHSELGMPFWKVA